jgi:hypothetical protein
MDPRIWDKSYVNWLVTLLHVIRSEKVGYTSKLVEKTVFESKHWGRPDNSCFGKDRTDNGLSSGLELSLAEFRHMRS